MGDAVDSIKIILIGDSGSGKSALIQQYVHNVFNVEIQSTIGFDLQLKKTIVDDKPVTMQFWDTAGQERFHSMPNNYYRGTHCCVLIFDVTSMTSYQHLHVWRDEFITKASPREPDKFPFVLIGNKTDMQDRQVSTGIAQKWCQLRNDIPYFECSAKDNVDVEPAFETVARLALQQKEREFIGQKAFVEGELVEQNKASPPPVEKEKDKANFETRLERALSIRHSGPAQGKKCGADAFYDDDDLPENAPAEQIEDDLPEKEPVEQIQDDLSEREPAEQIEDDLTEKEPAEQIEDDLPEKKPTEQIEDDLPEKEPAEQIADNLPEKEPAEQIENDLPAKKPADQIAHDLPEKEPAEQIEDDLPEKKPAEQIADDPPENECRTQSIVKETHKHITLTHVNLHMNNTSTATSKCC